MAPGCKPGGLTPYGGSNPPPCTTENEEVRTRRRCMKSNGFQFIVQCFAFIVAQAGVAQLVEHQPSKLRVASSNLVSRSIFIDVKGCVAIAPE
jgi:hypothetical protein